VPNGDRDDLAAMEEVIRDLSKKLARDGARRESAEARLAALAAALRDKEHQLQVLSNESEALRRELDMVEQHFSHATATPADPIDLAGATIMYVGGRANQIPQLRALVESSGGQFLHHDGGLEQSLGQLPGIDQSGGCRVLSRGLRQPRSGRRRQARVPPNRHALRALARFEPRLPDGCAPNLTTNSAERR
jgi:hypothetical protein